MEALNPELQLPISVSCCWGNFYSFNLPLTVFSITHSNISVNYRSYIQLLSHKILSPSDIKATLVCVSTVCWCSHNNKHPCHSAMHKCIWKVFPPMWLPCVCFYISSPIGARWSRCLSSQLELSPRGVRVDTRQGICLLLVESESMCKALQPYQYDSILSWCFFQAVSFLGFILPERTSS
jgi:hypothetical protein